MKIIAFADVHYFGDDIDKAIFDTNKKLVRYALPLTDKLIDLVNADPAVTLCVNLGDIIQDTQSKEKDMECLRFMFERLGRIQCPCYSILGNHDLKMMDTVEEVEQILGQRSTGSVNVGGYHLVFLTTEVRPELGLDRGGCYKAQYLSAQTLAWLKGDLEQNDLPCVIFTHYGLAEDSDVADECMFMKNRADVKALIRGDKNVRAVISGHQHKTKMLVEDGVPYYLVGSMTACSEQPGVPDGVYMTLTTDGNELQVTTHRIAL